MQNMLQSCKGHTTCQTNQRGYLKGIIYNSYTTDDKLSVLALWHNKVVFVVLCLFLIQHMSNRRDNNCHEDMTEKREGEFHKVNK